MNNPFLWLFVGGYLLAALAVMVLMGVVECTYDPESFRLDYEPTLLGRLLCPAKVEVNQEVASRKREWFEDWRARLAEEFLAECAQQGFSDADCARVQRGELWFGMPKELALLSRGNPTTISRTVTAYSVSEQWVYNKGYADVRFWNGYIFIRWKAEKTLYLYFRDGILTAIQD